MKIDKEHNDNEDRKGNMIENISPDVCMDK